MANTPQAKKRIRRNATRATINHSRVSRIRTFIKAVESAIESGKKKEAAEALKKVQPEIAKGVSRGVIHKNTAARRFSRLSKRVASLGCKSMPKWVIAGRRETGCSSRFWNFRKMQLFPRFARELTSS